jgi:hypothetical protein
MLEENIRTIVPDAQGGWKVRSPRSVRASAWCASKAEAEMRAREILRNTGGGELRTLDATGTVVAREPVRAPEHPSGIGRNRIVRQARSGYGRTSC